MSDALEEAVAAVRRNRPRSVVVFTGAGISAESGIPTFRGPGGLWRNYRSEQLATPGAFAERPELVWEWYEWRRNVIRAAAPNAAHLAIARLRDALVVTQNVDGLHARAGSERIIELHGNIFRTRCTAERTVRSADEPFATLPPRCGCGAMLRPDVVWFGEMLPPGAIEEAEAAIRRADLLLVIGTSGVVWPAAGLVRVHRGLSIEINPTASEIGAVCDITLPLTAVAATPPLIDALLEAAT